MSLKSLATKFKNEQGVHFTKGLFYEQTPMDKSSVVYTLKDQAHEGFPSLYLLFMEAEDLTEWEFANDYLGGWAHWKQLCNCMWFKPYIERWREELELKVRGQALRRIKAEAKSNSRNAYTANKFLVDAGWRPKEENKNTKGRPTKDQVQREARKMAQTETDFNSDFERIMN